MDYQYCAMLMSLTALLLGLSHVVTGTVSVEDISDGDKKIVVLDENANFKCTGASSQDLEWTHTGIIGEVILEDGPPYVINVATVGSQTLSLLTIEGVQMEDAGTLTCRDVQDNNDKVSFTLEVSETAVEDPPANWQTPEIQLDNPDASVVEFDGVVAPTLKCVGGALGSELVFLRDGDVLVDGATDTITSAQDVNSGLQTVMLTPAPIAGHYTCRDTTYPGSDSDSVELVVNTNPTIVFEIVEPAGEEEFRVLAGGSFSVRCRGALGAEIVWYQGETLLEDELGGFLITDSEDVSAGTVTSLLTKEDSEVSDSGLYACVNSLDNDQRDEIQIDVQQPGDAEEQQGAGADDNDDDDDDKELVFCLFCGVSGLLPSLLVVLGAAVLSLKWAENGGQIF